MSPIYNMSFYKAPRGVLKSMEAIRSRFFNGADSSEKKITWVAWDKVLASKKNGGLGVSSFYALNRALLLKWVWRFLSQDGSLWCRVIQAIYGSSIDLHPTNLASNWCLIVRELNLIKDNGFDFISHCKKHIGDGSRTSFWHDSWTSDMPFRDRFPRLFALELDKDIYVAAKLGGSVVVSFRMNVRDGVERSQLSDLFEILEVVSLSSDQDSWICDLSEDGEFHVKEVRNILDELILPFHPEPTRWVKYVPIKINVFAWRARRDCLPTRSNLIHRGVVLDSAVCPLCQVDEENVDHILFQCDLAKIVFRKICYWWELI
uniref:RNA-directed DNA polymerase, eukaryota n=1 Tax=Tanacetum cinerariifolium TaxID=118510 RepID=A0A699KHF1_TANCI|nr:RNA-directed DNA polymerase, eukaryota [Tanacetum cinerariifolium]